MAEIEHAGGRAILLPGDVADQAAVERMVAETVAAFGRLDIAVSNAAYSDREPFYEADMAGFRRTIDVTMWGAFLPGARRRAADDRPSTTADRSTGGSIVVVSSPHAYIAVPRSMAYNMSKAAIDQMARTAAIELVEHQIRVNIVTPGWIDTPGERKFASDETIQRAGGKLPWKRLGTPEEIGRGVVFLCDPASDYITGSCAVDRRRHHAALVGQPRIGRARVSSQAVSSPPASLAARPPRRGDLGSSARNHWSRK